MDKTKIQTTILIVIGGLFLANMLFGNQSMKSIKNTAKTLQAQSDSLKLIANDYKELQDRYIDLYIDLENTRNKVYAFKEKIEKVREGQLNSANKIKGAIDDIITEFEQDTLKVHLDTARIDSLKF